MTTSTIAPSSPATRNCPHCQRSVGVATSSTTEAIVCPGCGRVITGQGRPPTTALDAVFARFEESVWTNLPKGFVTFRRAETSRAPKEPGVHAAFWPDRAKTPDAAGWNQRGADLAAAGSYTEAIAALTEAIRLSPEYAL